MRNYLHWVFIITLCFTPFAKVHAISSEDSLITWSEWQPEAFEKARKEDKMIIVNVGIEVCFACRWMEEGTYQIPEVANIINEHFVTIQVDANARPDLGERYSDWAWPATIFLAPDGTQVLAVRGSRRPRNFIPILNRLIEHKKNGTLEADALRPYSVPPAPATTELTKIRDRIRRHLDNDFDTEVGGWGDELKEINDVGRNEQLIFRAFVYSNKEAQDNLIQTAYAMATRMDPVWGGFYAAGYDGWTKPIPEKRSGAQASALITFAWAYKMTNDVVFLEAAASVDRYLKNWMLSDNNTFFTSQEDEPENLPNNITPLEYFNLDDKGRRAFGTPPIDHTIYTDINGRLIRGYADLYEVTGNEDYLMTAINAANTIIENRQQKAGWVSLITNDSTLSKDDRIHKLSVKKRPYLRAQAQFGNALLALLRVTGDQKWLITSNKLAQGMITTLKDKKLGGFYGAPKEGTEHIAPLRKPLEDNGSAAKFLYQLGYYSKNDNLKLEAELAIRSVSSDKILSREGRIVGNLAVALEIVTAGYLEYTVIGSSKDPRAIELFEAAKQQPDPRKILSFEAPGRYPDSGKPSLYICSKTACSVPIFKAEHIAKHAKKFLLLITPKS